MKFNYLVFAVFTLAAISGANARTFGPISCSGDPCKAGEECTVLTIHNGTKPIGISCGSHYIERNRLGPNGNACDRRGTAYSDDNFDHDSLALSLSFNYGFQFAFLVTSLFIAKTFPKHVTLWSNMLLSIGLFAFVTNFYTVRAFTYGVSLGWWGLLRGDSDARYGNVLIFFGLTCIVFSQLLHLLNVYAIQITNLNILPAAYLTTDFRQPSRVLKTESTQLKKRSESYKALLLLIGGMFILMVIFSFFLLGPLGKSRDICERLLIDSKATYWFAIILAVISGIVTGCTLISFFYGMCNSYKNKRMKALDGEMIVHGSSFWDLYKDVMMVKSTSWWSKILLLLYSAFWIISVGMVFSFLVYQLVNYDSKRHDKYGFDIFDLDWTYLNLYVWVYAAGIIGMLFNLSLIANTNESTQFLSVQPVQRLYNKIVETRTKYPDIFKHNEVLAKEIDALASMRVSVQNLGGGNIEGVQEKNQCFTAECLESQRQRAILNALNTKFSKLHKKVASIAGKSTKSADSDDEDDE